MPNAPVSAVLTWVSLRERGTAEPGGCGPVNAVPGSACGGLGNHRWMRVCPRVGMDGEAGKPASARAPGQVRGSR